MHGGSSMQSRQCVVCGQSFRPRPQVPEQCYCGEAACQRERRRRWQQAKRRSDADYRDNEMRAERAWRKRHPEYWREYRCRHPQYTERNRLQQQGRDQRRRRHRLANMDASTPVLSVSSGTYRLTPVATSDLANMDAWTVEITLLSGPLRSGGRLGAILQTEDVICRGEVRC
jgi:hypothetical protein